MSTVAQTLAINDRTYTRPRARTAVVCLDGVGPPYLEDAFERRLLPRLAELTQTGVWLEGLAQLPSFTNPNNLSIVTGVSPARHGVPGNHYLAPDGHEVQLVNPDLVRVPTIHAAFQADGLPVLVVTTKEKLRPLLASGGVPCFSAERADEQRLANHDAPVSQLVPRAKPGIYDWDCSHYALELALELAQRLGVELLYVSLTDYVQHTAAPGDALSDRYLVELDRVVGRYLDAGWRVGLVADHGMNAKPDIRYLGELLRERGITSARVVLPITDPYVRHHAALGSACWVHVREHERDRARSILTEVPGIEAVLERNQAAATLALPPDRIGDLIVLADAQTALGNRTGDHDLSALQGTLRSHGGRHEQQVPILLSERPARLPAAPPSNADIHQLLLGVATTDEQAFAS
jgi:phosphonoacetate hydrolase